MFSTAVHWPVPCWRPAFTQGSYAGVNLMTRYDVTRDLSGKLNLNNVFDKTYYGYADSWVVYGEPRNFMTSMEYRF
nr:TonB-dependent receptor [Pseudomonas kurunegalensis]